MENVLPFITTSLKIIFGNENENYTDKLYARVHREMKFVPKDRNIPQYEYLM